MVAALKRAHYCAVIILVIVIFLHFDVIILFNQAYWVTTGLGLGRSSFSLN